jgi:outer membrane receptor protein involved in Fe transport
MTYSQPLPARLLVVLLAALALEAPVLRAQSAAASVPKADDEPLVLSPFEVTADDHGYLASNALSGTRLNTKLEDIASSITVVTKQQMLDTAVTDINDLFLYEASTEGTGNYTAFTPNRDGGMNDDIQADPQTANRIRGLGSANTAIGNYASNPKIPLDLYNIDAVEISRGPNSNIFGLGSGSGTVNLLPSNANVRQRSFSVSARADSFGSIRGSFDLNYPLLRDKLAVRIAGVADDKEFERKPSYDNTRRLYGALTYKPFKKTTLRINAESYHRDAQRPNYLTPQETITDWLRLGSPSWDPTTQRVTLADGTVSGPYGQKADGSLPLGLEGANGIYNRTSLYIEPDGAVGYWSVNRVGNRATPLTRNQDPRILQSSTQLRRERGTLYPLFFEPGVTDKSIYDWSSLNYIAPNRVEDEARTYVSELEQFLVENEHHLVAARLGWFRQEFERYARNMISSNDTVLFVDVNEKLLDGTPNPYYQRPYVTAAWPIVLREPEDRDTKSVDLVYQWTPERRDGINWIGQQRFNLHGEYRETESTNYRFRDYVTSNHSWLNASNRTASTQTLFQYYLGDATGFNVDYAPSSRGNLSGTYPFHWYDGAAKQWVTEQATLSEAAISGTSTDQEQIRTFNLTYQGFFWNDRLVPTIGFRRDRQRLRSSAAVTVDPATGFITYDPLGDYSNSSWLEQEGDTKTYGLVFKATSWLNLFYNQSDSFNPLGISYNIYEQALPNPTSKGKDYGFALNLLDGKLVVRVNRYDSTEINSRRSQIGTVGSRIHRLEGVREPYDESFYPWAENVARERFEAQGVTPTSDQLFNAAAEIMQLDPQFLKDTAVNGAVGVPADVTSRGYEIEVNYNPTPNWRMKLNVAQQEAIDSNIGNTVTDYLASRLPVWTSAVDDQGNRWWDADNGAARVRYLSDILAPYSFEVANSGKPRSQVREWRANGLTNYDFTSGALRNWSVGGAVRWESKGAIGFLGKPPGPDGVVLELDPNQPVWDKARFYFDLSVGYRFKLFNERIRGRVQLNVRDLFEDGRLQPVAVNPDGTPYAFRIIEPRQFILSTTFDF